MGDWVQELAASAEAAVSGTAGRAGDRPRRTPTQVMMTMSSATRPRRRQSRAFVDPARPVLRLYGEIGEWGTTAEALAAELETVTASELELRINSPGGDVYDGIAMYNLLRDHQAAVMVTVDGIAASAASFIAMAGDRVTMGRQSQIMIHDAMTLTFGNESEHLQTAEFLSRSSNTIASIYAERAGGTVEQWREAMRAETWFDPDQAVAAGLADATADDSEGIDLANMVMQLDLEKLAAQIRTGLS